MRFTTHTITDSQFGGMRAATFAVPAGWRTRSQVMWDFGSTNYPVTAQARAESPDGSMWIELLPIQVIYWMSHYYGQPIPVGERRFGAVHAPKATAQQAMQHLVVQPLRGRMPGFQIIGTRAVDPSFNPNVGGNPAQTWQRMSPSR